MSELSTLDGNFVVKFCCKQCLSPPFSQDTRLTDASMSKKKKSSHRFPRRSSRGPCLANYRNTAFPGSLTLVLFAFHSSSFSFAVVGIVIRMLSMERNPPKELFFFGVR